MYWEQQGPNAINSPAGIIWPWMLLSLVQVCVRVLHTVEPNLCTSSRNDWVKCISCLSATVTARLPVDKLRAMDNFKPGNRNIMPISRLKFFVFQSSPKM